MLYQSTYVNIALNLYCPYTAAVATELYTLGQ